LKHATPLRKAWPLCEGTEVKHVTQLSKGVAVILLSKICEGTELEHDTPLTKGFEAIHHNQLYEGTQWNALIT
jgi:hypothetical protein